MKIRANFAKMVGHQLVIGPGSEYAFVCIPELPREFELYGNWPWARI